MCVGKRITVAAPNRLNQLPGNSCRDTVPRLMCYKVTQRSQASKGHQACQSWEAQHHDKGIVPSVKPT
jgi:hypothetical protein